MNLPIAAHPDWNALLAASQDEEAWQELQDRRDRMAEHGPATCTHDQEAPNALITTSSGGMVPGEIPGQGLTGRHETPPLEASSRAEHAHLAPPTSAAPQANGARRPTPPSPRPAGPSLNNRRSLA